MCIMESMEGPRLLESAALGGPILVALSVGKAIVAKGFAFRGWADVESAGCAVHSAGPGGRGRVGLGECVIAVCGCCYMSAQIGLPGYSSMDYIINFSANVKLLCSINCDVNQGLGG